MNHPTSRAFRRQPLSPAPASARRAVAVAALLATVAGPADALPAGPQGAPPTASDAGHVETMRLDGEIIAWGRLGGVTADSLGYVYVSAFGEEAWKIAPDGEVSLLARGFYGASGNAIDINGDLLQSSFFSNSVHRIDRRTGAVSLVTDRVVAGPVAIAVAPDGTLFVASCNDNTVTRVRRDGAADVFARSDLFACPNGIAFDNQGFLYVVNFSNDHVVKIDAQGNAERLTTLEPPGGWSEGAIAAGVRGSAHLVWVRDAFYVTDIKANLIYRVQPDGTFGILAGTGAPGNDDGPLDAATFAAPNGIGAFQSTLFVNTIATGAWRSTTRGSLAVRKVILPR